MPNTNCLEGIACPQCGSLGPFRVEIRTFFLVSDDGWSDKVPGRDEEWDGPIECDECDHAGTIKEFLAGPAICHDCDRADGTHADTCPEYAANLPEPPHDDSVKCCPDCETPNQFGELCQECFRERDRLAVEHAGGM